MSQEQTEDMALTKYAQARHIVDERRRELADAQERLEEALVRMAELAPNVKNILAKGSRGVYTLGTGHMSLMLNHGDDILYRPLELQ